MNTSNFNSDDPKFWKYGVFYYNKEDRRIFPPKRTKWLGWTVNFANPFSIIAFIILIAIILIISYILLPFAHN